MKNEEQAEMIAGIIGGRIGETLRKERNAAVEIRLRVNRNARIKLVSGTEIILNATERSEFQGILLRLMENSLYACEDEMRQGYFTAAGGCRVGVCGKWNPETGMVNAGSACIRIAREIKGCAAALLPLLQNEECGGILILSRPGMGKTTILRDLARLVSDSGMNAAIADERREIAACVEGMPQMDVGERTDVMDGCPKAVAIPMLIRSCAPDVVFADEIGGKVDADAIFDARNCGVKLVATAHAGEYAEAVRRDGIGELLNCEVFTYTVLLGKPPGTIVSIRKNKHGDG